MIRAKIPACAFGLLLAQATTAQWAPIATGIPGDLLALDVQNSTLMLVAATSGTYVSENSGTDWTLLLPTDPDEALVFSRSRFTSVLLTASKGVLAGTDTVAQQAVIFNYTHSTGVTEMVFTGATGTRLNRVVALPGFAAVGNDGLFVYASQAQGPWTVRAPFTAQDLTCASGRSGGLFVGGDSCLYRLASTTSAPQVQFAGAIIDTHTYNGTTGVGLSGDDIYRNYGGPWSTMHAYDGPVTPTCAAYFGGSNQLFVGTTDGILFGNIYTSPVLQHQPTADGYHVNDIMGAGTASGYAACDDGWLLVTTNNGGAVEPYVDVAGPNGGCTGTNLHFTNNGASNVTWLWTLDGTPYGSFSALNLSFPEPGEHTLTLTGTSGPYSDEVTLTFQVVDPPPFTTAPHTVSDTLFCHSGESTVTITASDNGYRYRLYRLDDMQLLDQATGNGGALALSSGVQSDSCTLGIAVVSLIADCETLLADSIPMHIEQTRAGLLPGSLNAALGEPVTLFNTSQQAASYQWSFSNGASPAMSISEDPTTTFAVLGASQATLIATSAAGCVDTVSAEGPYIYDPSTLDADCWAYRATTWSGNEDYPDGVNRTSQMAWHPLSGALYVAGQSYRARIESRTGRTYEPPVPEEGGNWFSRYDEYGMLKWCIYGGSPYYSENYVLVDMPSIVPSRTGTDVFLYSGHEDDDIPLLFPDGSTWLGTSDLPDELVRVDELGRPLWIATTNMPVFTFTVDAQDNIFLLGHYGNSSGTSPAYHSPGGITTALPPSSRPFRLVKLDPQGEFLWAVDGTGAVNNSDRFNDLATDSEGGVVVVGNAENDRTFNSTDGASLFMDIYNNQSGISHGVILKYNADGELQWGHHARKADTYNVVVDAQDNAYMTVRMTAAATTFNSVNAPPFNLDQGRAILTSYSPQGDHRWTAVCEQPLVPYALTLTPDGGLVAGGTAYDQDYGTYRFGPIGGPPVDSIWSYNSMHFIGRWDLDGNIERITTLAGDSCGPYFGWFNEYNIRLTAGPGGDLYCGTNHDGAYPENAPIAGDTIDGQGGHLFTVLAHLDASLCDPDPDIALFTSGPPSSAETTAMSLGPVPADEELTVRLPDADGPQLVQLFDARGACVAAQRANGATLTLDVSALDAGSYNVVVSGRRVRQVGRVVVAH